MIGIDYETDRRKGWLSELPRLQTPTGMQLCWYGFLIAVSLLVLSYMPNKDGEDQIKAESQAEQDARLYWLRDAGREREEMRQLYADVKWAELSERAKKLKGRK